MATAEITFAPVLADHSSPNLAPIKPLTDLVDGATKPRESSVQKSLQDHFRHHISVEKQVRESMILSGYQVASFIEGNQLIRPNPWLPGQWLPYTPRTNSAETRRTLNLMRFYASNCEFKWQLSNPDVVALPGVETEEAREAAQAADIIVEHYERKFFQPFITRQEAMHGLCWGTYIWRIRYDDQQTSITSLQPIFGDQQVTLGGGFGTCAQCGFQGTADQFPSGTCPECGGEAMVEPPAQETIPSVVGAQPVAMGELCAELLPFPECFWDYRYRAEESSWFIHQRRTSISAVRRLLGNIKVPVGGEGTKDIGLDIMDKLAWSTQHPDDHKRKVYETPVVVGEYSLGPDDIADITISAPEMTVSGQPIPAGPLINTFPNGLTVQYLNGLQYITGIFAEHHSREIVQGIWHVKPLSGTGQGLSDLVEVQKRFNADDSQVHTFFRATASPAMLVRQEALGDTDRAEYLGDPRINIPINSMNMPENTKLNDIVAPAFQPQNIPSQFFNYVYERLNDFAQLTSHVTDFSGGLPNVKNRTATGAQITQANSNALFTPPLQVKGEVRQKIAKIVIELYRRHFPEPRPFALQGAHGRNQYRYLSAADLASDIQFEVVKDSELPKNSFTKREDYTNFFLLFGGAAAYLQMREMFPEFTLEIERTFNINLESEPADEVASLCQQRIAQMSQAAMVIEDPQMLMLMITPPLSEVEPDNDLKAQWLQDWMDDDAGQTAPPSLRGAVELLVIQHFTLFAQQEAAKAALMPQDPMQAGGGGGVEGEGGATHSKGPSDGGHNTQPSTKPTNVNTRGPITGRPQSKGK